MAVTKCFKDEYDESTAYLLMKVGIVVASSRPEADYEDIFTTAKRIYLDWINEVDEMSEEEVGYIQKYAERKMQKAAKVKALATLRNGLNEVLFIGGDTYDAVEDGDRYIITNELQSETIVRKNELLIWFEIC